MKKILDEKGKLFGKVSIIDLLVVVVLLVLAVAIYSRFFVKDVTSSNSTPFTYELCVRGVRTATVDALQVGDEIYDSADGTYLGKITATESIPSKTDYNLMDGTFVVAGVENRYDVTLTVETTGLVKDGRYYSSGTYLLNVNHTITFNTKYCVTSAFVWAIH